MLQPKIRESESENAFAWKKRCRIERCDTKLGADYSTKQKFSFSTKISEAEIVGLERVVRKFVDAFNKICDLTEFSKEDLERFRIVFSAARIYFDLYFKLQKFEEVEARVEMVEKLVEQLAAEKSGETSQ